MMLTIVSMLIGVVGWSAAAPSRYNPARWPFYQPVVTQLYNNPQQQPGNSQPTNADKPADPAAYLWYHEVQNAFDKVGSTANNPNSHVRARPSNRQWQPGVTFMLTRPPTSPKTPMATHTLAPAFTTRLPSLPPRLTTAATLVPPDEPESSENEMPNETSTTGDIDLDTADEIWRTLKAETRSIQNELRPMKDRFDDANNRLLTLLGYFVEGLYQRTRAAVLSAKLSGSALF